MSFCSVNCRRSRYHETLKWLDLHLKDDIQYCKRDWQIMSPGEALTFGWENFCHAVKHETRFLFFADANEDDDAEPFQVRPGGMLTALGEVIRDCDLIQDVRVGKRMFRARGHKAGATLTEPIDLGPPPEDCAKSAGRMNAPGIVVMYASIDRETALAEAPGDHSDFSVAEFELLKDVRAVDLTHIPPTPSIFEDGARESLQFLHRFAEDVSQPFTPDTEIHIEYTPTQVVSEYLRHRLRDREGRPIHGLLYKSAKDTGRINIALFIESKEVEGVPSERWSSKEPLLKMMGVEELSKVKGYGV